MRTAGWPSRALAVGPLRDLAETVQSSGNPSSWEALADYYTSTGWKADRSVLQALNAARSNAATKAVAAAIRAAYIPWLEKLSALTQSLASTYPTSGPGTCRTLPVEEVRFISLPTVCAWISQGVWKKDS